MTNKMTRRTFLGSAGIASLALAACGGGGSSTDSSADTAAAAGSAAITGTYAMHVQGYDYGAGVDKITLTLDAPIDSFDAASFTVTEHKQATDWTADGFPVIEADFPRTVTAATAGANNTIELELACDPNNGSPFLYTMATGFNTWCKPYQLNIALAEGAALTSDGAAIESLTINPDYTGMTTSADAWKKDSFTTADGATTFQYAAWDPETESKNLFVWLHGAGEGGTENTDPYVTILANKVVALSEDAFQSVVGGAHVVAPQCPTMWMDQDGKSTYIADDAKEVASFYTAALEEFIDSYAAKVGAEKIVVGGCSNGGFMTLWMGIDRPDKYAGIVPICEAIPDGAITDAQIEGIKDLPMYFVWSDDDDTVDPTTHEIPTTDRLKKAGATDLHISTTEHVVDTSGQYKNEDGTPYQYSGHWSWIYFDNNECECNDEGLLAFGFVKACFEA